MCFIYFHIAAYFPKKFGMTENEASDLWTVSASRKNGDISAFVIIYIMTIPANYF